MNESISHVKRFYRVNRKEINFIVVFISIYIAAHSLYYLSKPLGVPFHLQQINTQITSLVINVITPGEATKASGNSIKSGGISMSIGWGCEGIEGIFMIVAALFAYSMKRKWKIYGALAGIAMIFILNISRLFFLWYTFRYKPAIFDIMHVYVGQTFIIFFAVLFFILWIKTFANRQLPGAA
jgi:exosortase family protein XrtM